MGVSEVVPSVYRIALRGVNLALIAEERLALVDAGFTGSSGRIAKVIRSLGGHSPMASSDLSQGT